MNRGQQFHYTPLTPGLSIGESMTAYEKTFAELARLKKGMRVLDLGCGIGGPARTIAATVGCNIVGITNSAWHVERGTVLTEQAGMEKLVTFVHGDFCVRTSQNSVARSGWTDRELTQPTSETAVPGRVL